MSEISLSDLQSGTPWWGGAGCEMGDSIEGLVVSASREQQRDFDTNAPLEWDNGDPRMESVVVVETSLRDPEIDNDNGHRALHLRGGNFEPAKGKGAAGEKALKLAMQKSGLAVKSGVHIKAAITGMAKPTGRGRNPAKLWTIELSQPEGIAEDEIFDLDD